jgi:hypothetical protein
VQGLSNVAWACARMQLRMPLLDAIAAESISRLDSFTSQGVANLCWALAKVKHSTDTNFLQAFEQHGITNFPEYSSQGSSLLLWGLAQQNYVPTGLLKLLGAELQSCCGQFSPDSVAAVMGAFATINYRDEATLAVRAAPCKRPLPRHSLSHCILPNVCNIACVALVHSSPGSLAGVVCMCSYQ